MVELINLYMMLLDFHDNQLIDASNINRQVGVLLSVVDQIQNAFVVQSNVV